MKPVRLPITDVIDLHTFRPQEIPALIADYLEACAEAGFERVRIIHGKGTGFQKKRVREILSGHPLVAAVADAPPEAGGWGATVVDLAPGRRRPRS